MEKLLFFFLQELTDTAFKKRKNIISDIFFLDMVWFGLKKDSIGSPAVICSWSLGAARTSSGPRRRKAKGLLQLLHNDKVFKLLEIHFYSYLKGFL